MTFSRVSWRFVVAWILLLGGCATRQVNPPIAKYDPASLHQFQQQWHRGEQQDLIILAFSGGGTRAAAFSYGVLETLRSIQITTKTGRKIRLLDEVDVITGVSGGSFTALAYGLYGEKRRASPLRSTTYVESSSLSLIRCRYLPPNGTSPKTRQEPSMYWSNLLGCRSTVIRAKWSSS